MTSLHRLRCRTALSAVLIAAALAGCGSSSKTSSDPASAAGASASGSSGGSKAASADPRKGSAGTSRSGSTGASGATGTSTTPKLAPNTLTIYSSSVLQGPQEPVDVAVNNAELLALEQAHGRIGRWQIRFIDLDDSIGRTLNADPATTEQNAETAAKDPTAIAYIGESTSGATVSSLPILNRAGILQLGAIATSDVLTLGGNTPTTTLAALYPSGHRTFARVVPDDATQAVAQAQYQSQEGCQKTYEVSDGSVYGANLATLVNKADTAISIASVGSAAVSPSQASFGKLTSAITASGADCVFYGGEDGTHQAAMWLALGAAGPAIKLFGPDALANSTFGDQIGQSPVSDRTFLTDPSLGPSGYNALGQQFYLTYEGRFGAYPDPSAIFGYEAMEALLSSIKAAGAQGDDRAAVIRQFFAIRDRDSVLGTYSIDGNGDTTLTSYGAYVLDQGQVTFSHTLNAAGV